MEQSSCSGFVKRTEFKESFLFWDENSYFFPFFGNCLSCFLIFWVHVSSVTWLPVNTKENIFNDFIIVGQWSINTLIDTWWSIDTSMFRIHQNVTDTWLRIAWGLSSGCRILPILVPSQAWVFDCNTVH